MENKLLIIGNGFDLYHGLPTRYTDFLFFADKWDKFIEGYNKEKAVYDKENLQFTVRLSEKGNLIDESIEDFSEHRNNYNIKNIEYLDKYIRDNKWIEYFQKIILRGDSWVDFEREIENVLIIVEKYYENFLPQHINTVPIKYMPNSMKNIISLFSPTDKKYKNLMSKTLGKDDLDTKEINKKLFINNMKKELDVLNKCLNYYILEFVYSIKTDFVSEQIDEITDTYLINFNYTNTFKSVYRGYNRLIEQHCVHGNAVEENIVLGISDDVFLNLDYVYFHKYFQRIQKKTGTFYKKWIPIKSFINNNTPIEAYIMGHSLSKVDKGIMQDIFCLDNDIKKITIFYLNQDVYEQIVINLIDMFGKDFIIDQTAKERIVFVELKKPKKISLSPKEKTL